MEGRKKNRDLIEKGGTPDQEGFFRTTIPECKKPHHKTKSKVSNTIETSTVQTTELWN
jgi:hypothetical protein